MRKLGVKNGSVFKAMGIKVAHHKIGGWKVNSAFKDCVVGRDTKKPEPRKRRSLKSNPLRQRSDLPCFKIQLGIFPAKE